MCKNELFNISLPNLNIFGLDFQKSWGIPIWGTGTKKVQKYVKLKELDEFGTFWDKYILSLQFIMFPS